jgi:hypothetical protein
MLETDSPSLGSKKWASDRKLKVQGLLAFSGGLQAYFNSDLFFGEMGPGDISILVVGAFGGVWAHGQSLFQTSS